MENTNNEIIKKYKYKRDGMDWETKPAAPIVKISLPMRILWQSRQFADVHWRVFARSLNLGCQLCHFCNSG